LALICQVNYCPSMRYKWEPPFLGKKVLHLANHDARLVMVAPVP
jgi:hypothetical protein